MTSEVTEQGIYCPRCFQTLEKQLLVPWSIMASPPLASSWVRGGGLCPEVGGLGVHPCTGNAISTGASLAPWGSSEDVPCS